MPEQQKLDPVAHVTGPEAQEMQSFLDELNALDMVLQKSVNVIVSSQVALRKKMRTYWAKIRLAYQLNPDFNYNLNHLTGDVYAVGLAVKPDNPKKPE